MAAIRGGRAQRDLLMLIPFTTPESPTSEASQHLRDFVFFSNLAAQEATGDALASVSAPSVVNRLFGSHESRVELFAFSPLIDAPLPDHLPSTAHAEANAENTELEVSAWVWIAYPLLEDTDSAEVDITLSVDLLPLPGELPEAEALHVWESALALAQEQISTPHHRRKIQVSIPENWPIPVGYTKKLNIAQCALDVVEQRELLPPGYQLVEVENYGVGTPWATAVGELLTQGSHDQHFENLVVEPVTWDEKRVHDAASRLKSRRIQQRIFLLVSSGNTVDGLVELSAPQEGDPHIAEIGALVVRRNMRGLGLAHALMRVVMHAAHSEEKATLYTTVAFSDTPYRAVLEKYSPRTLTSITIAEKVL